MSQILDVRMEFGWHLAAGGNGIASKPCDTQSQGFADLSTRTEGVRVTHKGTLG